VPSALVAHRPDIRAAEASLHAANAAIGMATAAQLPQITLNGAMGTSAATLASAFSPGSLVWSLGGGAAQSLLDGGALRHRKQAAIAARDGAEARWKGAVLTGFGDVARALHALGTDADALASAQAAHDAAAASADLTARQITHGATRPLCPPRRPRWPAPRVRWRERGPRACRTRRRSMSRWAAGGGTGPNTPPRARSPLHMATLS
jgi:outer membrane protein TolC